MNTLSTRPLYLHHRFLLGLSFTSASSLSSAASASPTASYFHFQRRSDEENRAVRVSVWWDFENCSLPSGTNVFKVAHCITSAVRGSGIKGPVQITAFGDICQLARANQEALSATGITLTHVPSGGKNSADRSLLLDLMYWVSHNPPPAHLFLISGDRDFAGILHRLRMSNYNILLACPDDRAPGVLCSAASVMWHWNALIRGESFAGKHFNQPPDGPYNSWYGHYKGVLEDPYAAVEPPAKSQTNSSDSVLVSETDAVPGQRLQPVPRSVLRKISRIVNAHPRGISLGLLGQNMNSGEVRVDKKYYGHKSFYCFLLSKPNLVKVKRSNGQFSVFPASCQASKTELCDIDGEARDSSVTTKQKLEPNLQETVLVESISDAENHALAAYSVSKAHGNSVTTIQDENLPLPSSCNVDARQKKKDAIIQKKMRYALEEKGNKPSLDEVHNSEACDTIIDKHCSTVRNQDSVFEMGYFQNIWARASDEKTDRASDEVLALKPHLSNLVGGHGTPDSPHSSDNKLNMDAKVEATTLGQGQKSDRSPSFFTKVLGWFKPPRKDRDANISDESIKLSNQIEKSKKDELFLMDSFWCDIESFLNTYKGSKYIWNSKTREEIAENLRKEGPLVIQPLEHDDVLHLIDLLISEKKWIKELTLSTYPFRVVKPTKGNAESAQTSGRLRSIILSPSVPSEKLPEQKKCKVSVDTTTKPCLKTKDEVLSDCKKLLAELFSESPEAINIGHFKVKFVERFGYVLDNRKLGYPKLRSLLQTIPDLKVGLNFVYSSAVPKEWSSGDEVESAVAGKGKDEEENDSPWEDLGPVGGFEEVNGRYMKASDKYESPVSEDDEMSGMEEEEEEEESNRRSGNDESSLLQILDSWHKEGGNGTGDGVGSQQTMELGRAENKQRPGKDYSFVADVDECGDKDRLIDGILANLQKSGQQRLPPMN
ncbi:hypothetical protein V2J09_016445 [Rumex salicifolius]